jgi:hypothetical protein
MRMVVNRDCGLAWPGLLIAVAGTYRDTYTAGVQVRDAAGRWDGIGAWSAHEREAIVLGVRAQIAGIWASSDLTILEIDFTNPTQAPDHCPPAAPSSTTSPKAGPTASTSTTCNNPALNRSARYGTDPAQPAGTHADRRVGVRSPWIFLSLRLMP